MNVPMDEEALDTVTLSLSEMYSLAVRVLVRSGTSEENAGHVATALSVAESDGLPSHGMSRLPSYAAQVRSGKVKGRAVPVATEGRKAVLRIDARDGFAFPALSMAIDKLVDPAREYGVAIAAIVNSHHCGAAGYHVERLVEQDLAGIMFANSPAAIAPWGGNKPLYGTNPIAFAAPRSSGAPLVIDLSLAKAARGKINVAAQKGDPIPEGWALDSAGNPTTNAQAAMQGSMLPMGDAKGSALVMMVEIMAAAMTGANFGHEASSFFTADGAPPRVGQLLIAFDQTATNDVFTGNTPGVRIESLVSAIKAQPGARAPGDRRAEARRDARFKGVEIPAELHRELTALATGQV